MKKSQRRVNAISKGFLSYLSKNKEAGLLSQVIEKLKENLGESEKVTVVTPIKLSEEEEGKTYELVKKLTRRDNFKIDYKVDSKILDGMKVEYRDKLWDMSLSGQIENLSEKINS
jgi:F0F1-type ATP synthase delta subunit